MANTVNQPDGSSASSLNPPGPAAAADPTSWVQRYLIDWSAEDTYSFQASGAKTIDGVEWSVGSTDKAVATTGIQIVNGQGLNMAPLTSATSEWHDAGSGESAPRVAAQVKAGSNPLYSSTSYTQAYAFQAIIEPITELSANHNEYGLGLCKGNVTYDINSTRKFDSSVFSAVSPTIGPRMAMTINSSNSGVNGSGEAAVHQFFELVWFPGGTVYASSSSATDFVEPLSATTFQKETTTNTVVTQTLSSLSWDADDMYAFVWIANEQAPTAAAIEIRIKKFRMLTLGA
tara:strand:- start:210 stop:1073 length:864 start_codon:yes stop_codon:yes gene_type:complete